MARERVKRHLLPFKGMLAPDLLGRKFKNTPGTSADGALSCPFTKILAGGVTTLNVCQSATSVSKFDVSKIAKCF